MLSNTRGFQVRSLSLLHTALSILPCLFLLGELVLRRKRSHINCAADVASVQSSHTLTAIYRGAGIMGRNGGTAGLSNLPGRRTNASERALKMRAKLRQVRILKSG